DLALQQHHAAIEPHPAHARLRPTELPAVRGDDDVAAENHFEAAAEREAVHPCDHRDVERSPEGEAAEAVRAARGPVVEAGFADALEIGAGAKGLGASAGQNHAAHIVPPFDLLPDPLEARLGFRIDRVHPVGPIEGDSGDLVLDDEVDAYASFPWLAAAIEPKISSLCSPRRGGAMRTETGAADMSIGDPMRRTGPAAVSPASRIILLIRVCSSSSASPMVLTGAQRISTSSRRLIQCSVEFVAKRCRKILWSSGRWAICASKSA